jgi:hypothetical protein
MKEKGAAVYKLSERLEIVDTIPRNSVGKVLKKELREDIKKKLDRERTRKPRLVGGVKGRYIIKLFLTGKPRPVGGELHS